MPNLKKVIRQKLKRVSLIYDTWVYFNKVKGSILEIVLDIWSAYYLKRIQKRTNCKDIITVGFIVQVPSIWYKQVGIYEEMLQRENIKPLLFAVPDMNWESSEILPDYTDNYFLKHYPCAVKAMNPDGSLINFAQYDLDYLFYPRPYDTYLPADLRSSNMVKYVKCCHVPYSFSGSDNFIDTSASKECYRNMYFAFMDSKHSQEVVQGRFQNILQRNVRHIENLGYPSLDNIIEIRTNSDRRDEIKNVMWTPRWSDAEIIGGSNFLKYKNLAMDFFENNDKLRLIFRPHPLLFPELKKKMLMSDAEKDIFLARISKVGGYYDYDSDISDSIRNTDVFITDFSGIVIELFLSGKPLIYCEGGIKLNKTFQDIIDCSYVAHNWGDVEKYMHELISGNDYLAKKREHLFEIQYSYYKNSARKIVDRICADAGLKCIGGENCE